jgi:hypothetical protein
LAGFPPLIANSSIDIRVSYSFAIVIQRSQTSPVASKVVWQNASPYST